MLKDKYKLLHDAYFGIGLFEDGAGLRQHPRESIENFRDRQGLAYYLNYTAPIVNAAVDPIFKDDIAREYNSSEAFEAFLLDCDHAGTSYQKFCKNAATQAKLYGCCYVVVDNYAAQEEALSAAVKNRHIPFLKLISPNQVKDWAVDEYGNFTMFQYSETIQTGANEKRTTDYTWTLDEWRVGEGEDAKSGPNALHRVPVVMWRARETKKNQIRPPSEYISIAQVNYFLYQLCSWHTQILRDQAFNILTMPDTGGGEVTVGTNNVLTYPPESSHIPEFIAPSAGPADMITDHMDRLIKEMFRMSGLDSVVGVRTDASKSGVAKQWEFEKTNQKLADFSVMCESADEAIIKLYGAWSNEDPAYDCEYPRDFKINDVIDAINSAQAALDLDFESPTYKLEVLKKVLAAYMPNIAPDIYDKMLAELEKALQDEQMNQQYGDKNVGDGDEPGADE